LSSITRLVTGCWTSSQQPSGFPVWRYSPHQVAVDDMEGSGMTTFASLLPAQVVLGLA
jgi:hypothetical protein